MHDSKDPNAEPRSPDAEPPETPDPNPGDVETDRDRSESRPKEYGGRRGPDPVRYGDWEKNGRCIDF